MVDNLPDEGAKKSFQENGDLGLIERSIRSAYNVMAMAINFPTTWTQNLLLRAVKKGNVDLVKASVRHGTDVNYPDKELGRTPIFHAIDSGDLDMVNTLIELDADVTHTDNYGQTPMDRVINARDINLDIGHALIEAGVNINEKDAHGRTLLHRAVDSENVEKIQALITLGADPDIKDKYGMTPRSAAEKLKLSNSALLFAINGNKSDHPEGEDAKIYELFPGC